MIETKVGKCAECGENIVLKQPETIEEEEALTDNDRGFITHVGIPDLMFHVDCHVLMCKEGRWHWDYIETSLSSTRYEVDLELLLKLDQQKGKWHHIPEISGVSPMQVRYDKATKKLVIPSGITFTPDKRVEKYVVTE